MMKKYCDYCGAEMEEDFTVCCNCGKTIKEAQKEKFNPFITKETEKDAPKQEHSNSNIKDDGSIGWFLLGLLVPFIGIILGAVWNKEKPKNARMLFSGFGLSLFISIILKLSPLSCIWGL